MSVEQLFFETRPGRKPNKSWYFISIDLLEIDHKISRFRQLLIEKSASDENRARIRTINGCDEIGVSAGKPGLFS